MSPGILGKKIGMTQIFRPDGQVVPVTLLKAGPCMVVQRKTPATDGYDAVQLGLLEFVKPARINKPATGHIKKAGVEGAELHRFRKTYADTLHEEGVSVNTIRIRLGHESLDVTLAYLKGKDAESEEAQEHANSSSLALYA